MLEVLLQSKREIGGGVTLTLSFSTEMSHRSTVHDMEVVWLMVKVQIYMSSAGNTYVVKPHENIPEMIQYYYGVCVPHSANECPFL